MQFRIPIDQALSAIDQALVIQLDKGLLHGAGQTLVHGKALAAPVDR